MTQIKKQEMRPAPPVYRPRPMPKPVLPAVHRQPPAVMMKPPTHLSAAPAAVRPAPFPSATGNRQSVQPAWPPQKTSAIAQRFIPAPPPILPSAIAIQLMRMKGSMIDRDFDDLLSRHGLHQMELDPTGRKKMEQLRYANEQLLRQSGRSSKLKRKYRGALEKRLVHTEDYLGRFKTQVDLERQELRQSLDQNFYTVYAAYLVFAFSQGLYVATDQGVCREMCFHWIARKRKPVPKVSFAQGKQGVLAAAAGLDSARMRRKFRKYHALRGQASQQNFQMELTHYGLTSTAVGKQFIGEMGAVGLKKVTGEDFMGGLGELGTAGSYVIAVQGPKGSHVIAMVTSDDAVEFMDPNLGEFRFAGAGLDAFSGFINDWWNKCMGAAIGTHYLHTGTLLPID